MTHRIFLLGVGLAAAAVSAAAQEEDVEALTTRAVLEYGTRIEAAATELAAARRAILDERAPRMEALRAAETEVARLEARIAELAIEKARATTRARELRAERGALDRNMTYIAQVMADALKGAEAAVLPGESAAGRTLGELRARIESGHRADAMLAGLDAADALVSRLERQLGGYTAPGSSLAGSDNVLFTGRFVFAGPVAFFRSDDGDVFGVVQERRGSDHVTTRSIRGWEASQAEALVRGEPANAPFDASGKALDLLASRGGLVAEIRKGGIVGYIILGLGAVAVALVILKLEDQRRLRLDPAPAVQDMLRQIAAGELGAARAGVSRLRATTRELFTLALDHAQAPRALLEELIEGFVLRQRMTQERRLPLLAVIATAGPLLGLLGTVTGMIKTFTLITVFGTGSAARLSGGISEALVATALGLAVAIPTLLVHGLLAHRIHRGMALLERHALDLAAALEEARAATPLEAR